MTNSKQILFQLGHVWGFAWSVSSMRLFCYSKLGSNFNKLAIEPAEHDLALAPRLI
jgi:hypothetical protein